jgi:uncharacterized membrane protein
MRKWIPPLIVIIAVAASLAVYSRLPDQAPIHWNLHGEPDEWGSRLWAAWTMPLVLAMLGFLFRAFPLIDPRRENYRKFAGAYEGIVILVMLYGLGVHFLLLAAGLGKPVSVLHWVPMGIGLLLVGIGLYLPQLHSNWFFGIRTPWTLSSDRVWERTHRLGGYVFTIAGALIAVSVLVIPRWTHIVMFCAILGAAIIVVAYSYFAWREEAAG